MSEDKRFWNIRPESRRIAHPQKVYLKFPNSDEFIEEYLVDLSMTGMFVRCMNPQESGTTFSFKMRLSAGASTVQGTAEVVWVRQDQHRLSHPKGMGVRFVHLEPDSRRQIQETVERYAQDPGEPQEMSHLRSVVEETLGEVLAPSDESVEAEEIFAPGPQEAATISLEISPPETSSATDERVGMVVEGKGSRNRWISVAAILLLCAGLGVFFWGQGRRAPKPVATVAEGGPEPSTISLPQASTSPPPGSAATVSPSSNPVPPVEGSEVAGDSSLAVESPVQVSLTEESAVPESAAMEESPKVAEETAPPPVVENPERLLLSIVEGWADAWSSQDVDSYLSFYSDRFRPSRGLSLVDWRKQRRTRLRRPSFVSVTVSSPTVSAQSNGNMEVRFVQTYRSNTLDDTVWKILEFAQEGESWKILRERVDS
ncbi:MAG: TIGR02266 family protein [Deltaproteobacteria bacterium]|nr:TIGR02266 family protein [Deltaproteobacteria bacterium]